MLVLYADDEGFTLMTPEGHQFAGWITFSAFARPGEGTTAQVRGPDAIQRPDLRDRHGVRGPSHRGPRSGSRRSTALAERLGVAAPEVEARRECMDKHRQWKRAGNVRHNAAVRSSIYRVRYVGRRRKPTVTG